MLREFMDNNTILLFIKIPPPVTGATLMNKRALDSSLLHQTFDIRSICISYMKNRREMGKWTVFKLSIFLNVFTSLMIELWNRSPAFVYFQLSPNGVAFLRDLVFVTAIKLFGVKIVFHMHGKGIKHKLKLTKLLYKYCFRNEYVICLSPLLTDDIEDVFRGKPFIVSNGIPDENPNLIKNVFNEMPKMLFLSNLIKSKGVLDFLHALRILYKKGFAFEAKIVGAEGDISKSQLAKVLKEYNLDQMIEYLGPKYDVAKKEILLNSNIFVFPTKMRHECFPTVILEAMQFGLPVVSTYEAAIPEIVDNGFTGFLVEKNAAAQLAEKLEILIVDPNLRKEMGAAGRKKFEQEYTLEKFEEKMKDVFQEVLNEIEMKRHRKKCTS